MEISRDSTNTDLVQSWEGGSLQAALRGAGRTGCSACWPLQCCFEEWDVAQSWCSQREDPANAVLCNLLGHMAAIRSWGGAPGGKRGVLRWQLLVVEVGNAQLPWGCGHGKALCHRHKWVSRQPVTQAGHESLFSKSSESLRCPLDEKCFPFPLLCGWQMLLTPVSALWGDVAAPALMGGLPRALSDLPRGKSTSLSKCSHKMGSKLLWLNFYELD